MAGDGGRRPMGGGWWLVAAVDGGKGGWLWMIIGVFWSFNNKKYFLPIGMLDFQGGGGNILASIFLFENIIFMKKLLQISYQI